MGVINITQRSEQLGNLGSTGMAHGVTNTDIGTVHHTTARDWDRNPYKNDHMIVKGLNAVAGAIGIIVKRERDRKVDEFTNAVLDNMEQQGYDERPIDDWNTPERKHLNGQKRGFYLRQGEGAKTLPEEWDKAFGDTFKKIGDSIDADDTVRRITMEKLANYRRATTSRLSQFRDTEYRRLEKDAAKGALDSQINLWKGGRTEVLPDIFAAQDRVDDLNVVSPEMRKANKEKLALALAGSFIDNSLADCETTDDFERVEEAVKLGLKDQLPDEIAKNLPGGTGTIDGENRKKALEEIRLMRRRFVANEESARREAQADLAREFHQKELAMKDLPQELWADEYEKFGRDQVLRETDPARALRYMDEADALRNATKKAKAQATKDQIEANEDRLATRLLRMQILKMDGSLDPKLENEAQADIWREYAKLSMTGNLSPEFMQTFKGRIQSNLDDQKLRAITKFYRAFGYSPDLNNSGEPTATARAAAKKDSTDYYAPVPETSEERGAKVRARDLLAYGDRLIVALNALGPDMNKEGVVDKEINRLKTEFIKNNMDANIAETTKQIFNIQREARTRRGATNQE